MNKFYTIFLLIISQLVFSQNGNEWIVPTQNYLKVSITEEGFYRILPQDISGAGFNISSIDPRSFRLFRRGEDCSIRVQGEQDASFDAVDFIEFYAFPNDGKDEKELYVSGGQAHDFYSLYTDTAAYFLTWGGIQGKRIININPLINSGLNRDRMVITEQKVFSDVYQIGWQRATDLYLSQGDFGEGFFSVDVRTGDKNTFNFNLKNTPLSDEKVIVEAQFVGVWTGKRTIDYSWENGVNSFSKSSSEFENYGTMTVKDTLPLNFFSDNTLTFSYIPISPPGETDFVALSYIKVEYHKDNNLKNEGQSRIFEISSQLNVELNLPATAGHSIFLLKDSLTIEQISNVANNSFVLPNDKNVSQKYIYRPNSNFLTASKIEKASFVDFNTPQQYLLIYNEIQSAGSQLFKSFKESELGGGFKVGAYEIGDLYNTFSFGDKNPLAIRRLAKNQLEKGQAEYLMLMGRGIGPNYQGVGYYRKVPYSPANFAFFDFVPTFGFPGSDIAFTQGLTSDAFVPALATGRLPADNNQEIIDYVKKLEFNALSKNTAQWTKNFLHLSGGKTAAETVSFSNTIDQFAKIASGKLVGANSTQFNKKSNAPVESFNISEQVNNGLGIITYIGHSAPNTIEIDLGEVSNPINGYQNKGKYPLLFINGCNSLDMYNSLTMAENWLMTPEVGSVVVLGHSSFGYTSTLQRYTTDFYLTGFVNEQNYGKSIGKIQQETIRKYALINVQTPFNLTQIQQFAMAGDPSVALFLPSKPDVLVKNENVDVKSSNPFENLSASSDSLDLKFTLQNLGRFNSDSINICITRFYNNLKSSYSYPKKRVFVPSLEQELTFRLFNKLEQNEGENVFEIFLDCDQTLDETDEQNNILRYTVNISGNGVNLLFPYPYAIVGNNTLNFAVQSQDFNAKNQKFDLEISDDHEFKNLIFSQSKSADGVANFENLVIPVPNDTSTYYWRSRVLSSDGSLSEWSKASFTVISGESGWGQFEYGQFRENELTGIADNQKELVYDSVQTKIEFQTVGSNFKDDFVYNTNLIVNDRTIVESLFHPGCNVPGFVMLPFRSSNLSSYKGKSQFPYSSCGLDPKTTAHFTAGNAALMTNMISYLDSIPEGDYLVLLSTSANPIQSITTALKDALHNFGCFTLDTLKNGKAYLFVGRKGNISPLFEKLSNNLTEKISGEYLIKSLISEGVMQSPIIGPSQNWKKLSYESTLQPGEKLSMNFWKAENESYFSNKLVSKYSEVFTNPQIFMSRQPYFQATLSDKVSNTYPSMKNWYVVYSPVPEGVIVPALTYKTEDKLTFEQGQSIKIPLYFVNVSPYTFDSLDLYYEVKSSSTGLLDKRTIKLSALNGGDTLVYNLSMDNALFEGDLTLDVFFNPRTYPEQFYNNNFFSYSFNVEEDEIAPLVQIFLDDKIPIPLQEVSKNTVVKVVLFDNNKYKNISDTLGMTMFLGGPCDELDECNLKTLYFSNPNVKWYNVLQDFEILIDLKDLAEGNYYFTFGGADGFGNETESKSISFRVSGSTAISSFIPYPSPFSSNMRWAYQMTGSKQPERLDCEIYTADGILVKTMKTNELGELKPGSNLTDWSWDGLDQNGRELPNGIYYYQCIMEDSEIKKLVTPSDSKFFGGLGSILITR